MINVRWVLSAVAAAVILLVSAGCFPLQSEPSPTDVSDQQERPAAIAPAIEIEEKYYGGMAPYVKGQTRGRLYSNLSSYRLDADRLELGLMEIAQGPFPVEEFLFQEGQSITTNDLTSWLGFESESNPQGLNPEGMSTRVVEHILEHNYLHADSGELAGIVIGLSMAPVYQEQLENDEGETETITSWFPDETLMQYGQVMADKLTERLRGRGQDVPIVFAVYRLEEGHSMRPGSFLGVGTAAAGSMDVSGWQTINEVYYTFPSSELREYYPEWSNEFTRLREDVKDFFPQDVSMVGTGRFIDEQIAELTLNVTVEFASKAEVIQLTQFIGHQLMNTYPDHVYLNVYVQSVHEPQAVFVRPSQADPYMHVYR